MSRLYKMERRNIMSTTEQPLANNETFFGVSELADYLGVSRALIYRLCQDGKLPHYKIAGTIRVQSQDFLSFLETSRQGGNQ